jgi:hypothetical protein
VIRLPRAGGGGHEHPSAVFHREIDKSFGVCFPRRFARIFTAVRDAYQRAGDRLARFDIRDEHVCAPARGMHEDVCVGDQQQGA